LGNGTGAVAGLVNPNPRFWAGKRVFLTGHTGFKGAWLWLWLLHLGARPFGLSLEPETDPSLWRLLGVAQGEHSKIADIRDEEAVARHVEAARPEIVLHLAARALVRRSYAEPLETVMTNVIGTANVLEAVRNVSMVKAVLSVTTDKCYLNREWVWPYREEDPLGGDDPYSASKACAELITAAWRRSFLAGNGIAVATARAGNVIGGGDWSPDRLVPDCLAAMSRGEVIGIRNPEATRPWQHVLEPLSGYLVLAEHLHDSVTERGSDVAEAWNFGPEVADVRPVSALADRLVNVWGAGARWEKTGESGPHEAGLLALDASKARARLKWRPRLSLDEALAWTVEWYRRYLDGADAGNLVLDQIRAYETRSSHTTGGKSEG
jgi:CDP-glucose 4,6-dehydratase